MANVRIMISTDGLDEMIQSLRDLRTKGPLRAHEALDEALVRTFEISQDLTHQSHDRRHSGRLKASGDYASEHDAARGGWQGTISYSDRAAPFELERGGAHSAYIDRLAALSAEDFEKALDMLFRDL